MYDKLIISKNGKVCYGVRDESVRSAVVPEGVTRILSNRIGSFESLRSIHLPKSVRKMDEGVFRKLRKIVVDKNNQCFATADGALYSKNLRRLLLLPADRHQTQCSVRDGVWQVGASAFSQCPALESISLPKSVKRIEEDAFWMCSALHEVHIDERNRHFTMVDGVLYNRERTKLLYMTPTLGLTEYEVPEGVERICNGAFARCSSLRSVHLPESLMEIGDYAFLYCTALEGITLPEHLWDIGDCILGGCDAIREIHSQITDLEKVFFGIDFDLSEETERNCTVYVPSGMQQAYREHRMFCSMSNIQAEGEKDRQWMASILLALNTKCSWA